VPDPSNPEQTPGAATTDAAGAFRAIQADGNGLAPGKYRVGVTRWQGALDAGLKRPEEKSVTDDPYQAYLASGGGLPETRPGAGKVAKAASTPLPTEVQFAIEVTPETHVFDFDVGKGTAPQGAPQKDPRNR
jgi:hypothetical protein